MVYTCPWSCKKKKDGSLRPITDCRRPLGTLINNHMETTCREFRYKTVDCASAMMTPGCYMASLDIASAYRTVPVFPDHWRYQGVRWSFDNQCSSYLIDTHLCFGIRCAPYIFSTISDFVVRSMYRQGIYRVINYLDDFLVFGDSFDECQFNQRVLAHLLISLGFQIAWKKCSSPSTQVLYLGVNFDSVGMCLSMPHEKIRRLRLELEYFSEKSRCTKHQLQRLCGVLAYASKIIRGGRTFSQWLLEKLKGLPVDSNHRIRLSDEFKAVLNRKSSDGYL